MPNYTLTADAGSYALAGQVALLPVKAPADAAVFALTVSDAALSRTRSIPADVGDFALAGQDITFKTGHGIVADVGDFAIDGQAAALRWSRAPSAPLSIKLDTVTPTDNDAPLSANLN